ncbi:MAG: PHP domain-containing protein [Clostridia bacterium]|nr:PHP domain-containing protein [Clostridia bacterium]
MVKIDLHVHTTSSDGVLTPFEVVDEAYKNGVKFLAIADHDTVDAYTNELFDYAKSKGIILIPAVEISTKANKAGVHVLGYNFDLKNKEFNEKLKTLREARHDYLFNVAQKLNELGYILRVDELNKIEAVTKAHIALDIIENEKNKANLLQTFGKIPSKGEFIETIMNEGCPAYVKKNSATPKEAAETIRLAGGKVVLAHPVAYVYEDNLTENEILQIVESMKADGIETNYLYVDRFDKKHDDTRFWNDFAKKHNLKTTVGSDFHKDDGLRPLIGFANEQFSLTDSEVENILKFLDIK